ncbi:MAG: hypothetical protein WC869_00095 [Phycisphaerae bacterium]|jgi:hypothetical protein
MSYYVRVIEKKVIKQIECQSIRMANGVEGGVKINLNTKDYYTAVANNVSPDCKVDQ